MFPRILSLSLTVTSTGALGDGGGEEGVGALGLGSLFTATFALESSLDLLEELGRVIKDASLCGLGQTAPNPVLSTLRYFKGEYMTHINDKKCPAGVCKSLFTYVIDVEKCPGCNLCKKNCPQLAIEGEPKKPYKIIQDKCIKCGICYDVCKFDAVLKISGEKNV